MIKKTFISVIIAIIVSTVIAIFVHSLSSNNIISTIEKAVEEESIEPLESLFSSSDLQIDTIILEGFLNELLEDEEKFDDILESVKNQMQEKTKDTSAIVQVTVVKDRFGLFPSYTASLQEKELHLTGLTLKKADVKLDHFTVKQRDKNELHYGPIYAGEHLVEVEFENELGSFHTEEHIDIWEEDSIDINIDEEEIVANDQGLQEDLLEFGGLFTKVLPTLPLNQLAEYSIQMTDTLEKLWESEEDTSLGLPSLQFKEVVIDENSYNMLFIDQTWHSSARMIAKYEKSKGKSFLVLYELDFIFDPYIEEWAIEDATLSEVEQSVLDFWDQDLIYSNEDLVEEKVPSMM